MRLIRLAKKYGVTYSRYADDITFSTNQKEFPTGLAQQDGADPTLWHLSDELVAKIANSGFVVNNDKTRMHFRGSRQMVTGLVVNEKLNVASDYYRRTRAMCDSLFEEGKYFHAMLPPDAVDEDPKPDLTSNLNPLEGIMGFIYAVTQHEERRTVQEQRQAPRAIRKLFRRFLFYKYFLALNAPLIVTEGKTDPIYLREAVKSQNKFHPLLGSQTKDGFKHTIRYFNYDGLTHEVLDLGGGGTGNLKSIPLDYRRNLYASKKEPRSIKHRPMKFPVILVLDSDDGIAPIASTIKDTFRVQFSWKDTAEFYHVTDNLYVVKTPENGEKKTHIEDLFPEKWRKWKLNGKSFSPSNEIDPNTQYSKEVFAKSVVKPNAKDIDFSGFDPLLERISKVIRHHADMRK